MRHLGDLLGVGGIALLPPAIRPGLHCGYRSELQTDAEDLLPPAIRPGLHCGDAFASTSASSWRASPGHQAGAPLRPGHHPPVDRGARHLPPAIRPGLHCGWAISEREADRAARLPPAIRPGLHCGALIALSTLTGWTSSPGHQAGAPLRRIEVLDQPAHDNLPPAIRPGLHCGTRDQMAALGGGGSFPRPSGRGSIAARCPDRHHFAIVVPSPGHQAGAPLRQRRARCEDEGPGLDGFPRPSGRGSIAAGMSP